MAISSDRMFLVGNAALFQVTWFGCVVGGAAGQPGWAVPGLAALLALNLTRSSLSAEGYLAVALGSVGFGLDSLWNSLGLLDYGEHGLAPLWVVGLWLGLALTVNHSLGWLRGRPLLAAVLAAVAAPLTYLAGERLGAVRVPAQEGLMLVGAAWALLFWFLFSRQSLPGVAPVAMSADGSPGRSGE
ncbi:MAG TPA: DUF2878 domain-containing protein [Pseudomonadales bacterium]